MTAYFDDIQNELHMLRNLHPTMEVRDDLRDLEYKMVRDCTIAAESPEFPGDLRIKIHRLILMKSVNFQPLNIPMEHEHDLDEFTEDVDKIRSLCSDLHSIFHEVARHEDCPYLDNPLAPMHILYARGEEVREQMAAELAGTTLEEQLRSRKKPPAPPDERT